VKLEGLVCGGCVIAVKNALLTAPGVLDAGVSLERLQASVTYDPAQISPEAIAQAVREIGFGARTTAQVAKERQE
jgi:Cu+-exporting ATPase